MIAIGLGQVLAGLLLILSAIGLIDAGYVVLPVGDLTAGLWLLWHSISRIDPPSGGSGTPVEA